MANWTKKWEVASSSSDRVYVVSSDDDGTEWGCSCPAWKFQRKTCRHIKEIQEGLARPTARVRPATSLTALTPDESAKAQRAINSAIPSPISKTGSWPTLFKQTSGGKIQQWAIRAEGNAVITEYGLQDGKKQTVTDLIKEGKNIGRSNGTTPEEQARTQAQQEFDAKIKKGYVEDLTLAVENKNNLAAVQPMLAHPIEKKEKYAVFPGLAQPKLDGLRCIAIIVAGEVSLFSRTQKPINTVPHIVADLERCYAGKDIILDGELYNHALKDDFNEIIHLAKRDDVHADATKIQYHVYDVVGAGNWLTRTNGFKEIKDSQYIVQVETVQVLGREELDAYQAECIGRGYEGAMYRNADSQYENKRSASLLKVKTFVDDEFKIIGAVEGKGKLMGAIGVFVLITKDGVEVEATPACTFAQKVAYWKNKESYYGKMGTVKFQGYTPDGSLRFPVFKAVREDGD